MGGLSLGWLGLAPKKWNKKASDFFTGTPEEHEQVSTLRPEQEQLYQQLVNAGMNPGAGGAFGDAADYHRGNLSNNPQDFEAFAAPEMRNFNENIIPDLSEQFAGMGSGGLSSSGFRNAAVNAGVSLSEKLGAIRANLRSQSAQGLQNIGGMGLNNFSQDRMTQAGSPGLLSQIGPAAVSAGMGFLTGGPPGAIAAGSASLANGAFGQGQSQMGKKGPYGGQLNTGGNSPMNALSTGGRNPQNFNPGTMR